VGGERAEARELRIGYFAQHQLEQLASQESPLQNLRRVGGDLAARATEQELRDFLAGFGFRGDRVFEPVAPFSGGEKARLVLALVTFLRPNLLLLDEPTNHLDLEMRQALSVALQDYAGAVVLVSHDRHLLRTVADDFYIVHAGRAQPFDGDLEDYAQWLADDDRDRNRTPRRERDGDPSAAAAVQVETGSEREPAGQREAQSAEARKQRKREDAERRNRLSPLKAEVTRCEQELERLAQETAGLQVRLADPDLYLDDNRERLRELLRKQGELARATEQTEAAWLQASEQLEAAMCVD
jgi:ATP-binding cassette subfamily F protein 3